MTRGLYSIVMDYCESIDNHALVPAQLPLLVEFLSAYRLADQLKALSVRDAKQAVPLFPAEVEDVDASLRSTIDTVYLLTRCLYYQSLPPPRYLKLILRKCNQEWTEGNYNAIVACYRRFTRRIDQSVIACLTHRCRANTALMVDYDIASFALTEEDRARYYALSSFSNAEIRLRLYLIQYYNAQLKKVVHLVDLGGSKESDANTLGSYISLLTGYIFPSVKENFLELSIVQTVYQGKDSCPVVELDNRRVFTDMERSEYDEEDKNAMTSQCTFAQLYRQMQKYPVDVLRANLDARDRLLAVKNKGEQGLDWGGLYHDAIERW